MGSCYCSSGEWVRILWRYAGGLWADMPELRRCKQGNYAVPQVGIPDMRRGIGREVIDLLASSQNDDT
eukprot:jgi/Tetstr1/434972/TSEL_023963.t1